MASEAPRKRERGDGDERGESGHGDRCWLKRVSRSTGKAYYFNTATGATTWQQPAGYVEGIQVAAAADAAKGSASAAATATPATPAAVADEVEQLSAAGEALHFHAFHPEFRADGVHAAASFPPDFLARQLVALRGTVPAPVLPAEAKLGQTKLVNLLAAELPDRGALPLPPQRDRKGRQLPTAYAPVNPGDGIMCGAKGQGVGGLAGAVAKQSHGARAKASCLGQHGGYQPTPPNFVKPRGNAIYTCKQLIVNSVIEELFRAGTTQTAAGEVKSLQSAVNPAEGKHLYDVVRSNGFKRTLEVGMANGMSTLYIAQAVKDNGGGKHVAVDPFQLSQWGNAAKYQVGRAALDGIVQHMECKSYLALPQLLAAGEKFDFIFIDGMHTFDYTLLDFFYADLLLVPGGVICIDDMRHDGVGHCIEYCRTNYPHLKLDHNTLARDTMATFVKLAEDGRGWDFHANFGLPKKKHG